MDLSKYRPNTEFLLYKTSNGDVKVDVLIQNESIWMPQKKIAELFGVQRPAITKHLKNIFDSGELDEKVVCSILELTTQHGAMSEKKLNAFLQFNQKDILQNSGKVTAAIAKEFAEREYEKYRPIQNQLFESDFDKEIKKIITNYKLRDDEK